MKRTNVVSGPKAELAATWGGGPRESRQGVVSPRAHSAWLANNAQETEPTQPAAPKGNFRMDTAMRPVDTSPPANAMY